MSSISQSESMAQIGGHLAPFTVADMLDISFSLLKRNWRSFGAAALIFVAPLAVIGTLASILMYGGAGIGGISGLFTTPEASGVAILGGYLLLGIQYLYYAVAFPILSAVVFRIATASLLGGKLSFGEAARSISPIWLRLIGAGLLVSFSVAAGISSCILPGIFLAVILSLVVPVIAIEEAPLTPAFSRSFRLALSRFWAYLAVLILGTLVAFYVGSVIGFAFELIAFLFLFIGVDPGFWIFEAIATAGRSLVVVPVVGIISLLMYFDARMRREGYDISLMSTRLDEKSAS